MDTPESPLRPEASSHKNQEDGVPSIDAAGGIALLFDDQDIASLFAVQGSDLPDGCALVKTDSDPVTMAHALIDAPYVTVVGLCVTQIPDLRAFEALVAAAREVGKGISVLFCSAHTQRSTDLARRRFMERLQIPVAESPESFLACLRLFHHLGPVWRSSLGVVAAKPAGRLLTDIAGALNVELLTPTDAVETGRELILIGGAQDDALFDHLKGQLRAVVPIGRIDDAERAKLVERGIIVFPGVTVAQSVFAALPVAPSTPPDPVFLPTTPQPDAQLVPQEEARAWLARYGLRTPNTKPARSVVTARAMAADIGYPVVLRGIGVPEGSVAIRLDLKSGQEVSDAAVNMETDRFLVEEMIPDVVAELAIKVVKDPTYGFLMSIGPGGGMAGVLDEFCSALLPISSEALEDLLDQSCLSRLCAMQSDPVKTRAAVARVVKSLQSYVKAEAEGLEALEIEQLLLTGPDAIATSILLYRKDLLG